MKKSTQVLALFLYLSVTVLNMQAEAKVVLSPQALVIKEFNGQLYQMERSDWYDVNSYSDIKDHQIKAKDWYNIIKSGPTNEANVLLYALGQFLDKDTLWPYVEIGLLRKNNPLLAVNDQVANHAYKAWSNQDDSATLENIRTHPAYAKNITKNVNWDVLFNRPSKNELSLEDAIHKLKTTSLLDQDDYRDKTARYQAINRIAMHNNVSDLLPLIKDENFEVALGSWIALSKLAPKQVAAKVVDHALWLSNEIPYTYGSGCVRRSGQLVPVVAALDLFIDHLSAAQVKQVLTEIPDMWTQNKFDYLNVSHPKIKPIVLAMKANNFEFKGLDYVFNDWKSKSPYKLLAESNQALTDMKQASIYISVVGFDQKLSDYLVNSLAPNTISQSINRFSYYAFKHPNEHSFRYLKALVESPYFEQNQTAVINHLIGHDRIWPKKWQPMKQQILNQLDSTAFDDAYRSITLRLALN